MKIRKPFEAKNEYFLKNGAILLEKQIFSYGGKGVSIRIFSAEDLSNATNNYSTSSFHSRVFSTVYKGKLDGQDVAIKTAEGLYVCDDTIEFFLKQAVTQSQIYHKNVVKLLGCCLETEIPILVQELIPNGSLADHIVNKVTPMLWSCRLRIAVEVAYGVTYLHSAKSKVIIHRDLRSESVLLDENFTAKLSNFGFSAVIPSGKTSTELGVLGRNGYIDPEYSETGRLSEMCDVYSFGVVLVELITGNVLKRDLGLAYNFVMSMKDGLFEKVLDESILREGKVAQVEAFAALAFRCLRYKGEERPIMMDVTKELRRIQIMCRVYKARVYPHRLKRLGYWTTVKFFSNQAVVDLKSATKAQ
ncbi:hypothetical protein GIB67_011047 [Kingdonia uniflora]|uniref:Protein kinase domain-containing protein n=1 Tax=Kingdonia uniflora TaxID=39325 RepID=A0A7J7L6H4_9MAGN|nr:hypothetical protein GIB67_011047 [Kingdonia uniflora]